MCLQFIHRITTFLHFFYSPCRSGNNHLKRSLNFGGETLWASSFLSTCYGKHELNFLKIPPFINISSLTPDVVQHSCWYSSPRYALRIQPGRFCFPDILFGYKSMPAGGFRDDSTSGTACLSTVNSHH